MKLTKKYINQLVYEVIGAAIEVHKALGPGLLESVYHKCMIHELTLRGIEFQSEVKTPVIYKGIKVTADLRLDLLIENILPVELKATKEFIPIDEAQIMSYMTLLKVPKGLLINFKVQNIYSNGQRTYVNDLYRELPENSEE